jgi:hyperosmotically inducible periplasmic protein
MKYRLALAFAAPVAALAIIAAAPAFAQMSNPSASRQMNKPLNNPSASQSMRAAGESAESAGSNSAQAIEHGYHGAKTAAKDTAITAKVKMALKENRLLRHDEIHVSTSAGVVTLKGKVPSQAAATRAETVAKEATGVRQVRNQLLVMNNISR